MILFFKNIQKKEAFMSIIKPFFAIAVGVAFCFAQDSSSNNITVTDAGGNVYNTVKIGNQVWTVKNLKTTKYNDGTPIPLVNEKSAWFGRTTPAYCFYDNDNSNKEKYGALYDWHAVNTGKLAPKGWHVPTDAEWDTLQNYLIANGFNWDGTTDSNKIAKAMAAKTNWSTSTSPGTIGNDLTKNNRSGFSALLGGYRDFIGGFHSQGDHGCWWSATEDDSSDTDAYSRGLLYDYDYLDRDYDSKWSGFSVRLVKD